MSRRKPIDAKILEAVGNLMPAYLRKLSRESSRISLTIDVIKSVSYILFGI